MSDVATRLAGAPTEPARAPAGVDVPAIGEAAADPTLRVLAAYRAAALRMAGIPILNARLAVEAVGFRRWQAQWLGALITPCCLNVLLVPDDPAAWPKLATGDKRLVAFPAGPYEFIAGWDPLLGEHHSLSLFSPVLEFEDQLAARLTALAALDALFEASNFEEREVVRASLPSSAQAIDEWRARGAPR